MSVGIHQGRQTAWRAGHVLGIEGLSCGYGQQALFSDLGFELESGETLCLLGPNGAGKTTLFKTVLGFLKPLAGRVTFDGEDTAGWSRRRFGRRLGYIPQMHAPSFPFTVLEMVLMGRTPQLEGMRSPGKEDERIALSALDELGMLAFKDRDYTMLSGGERQMVLIARALAQQAAFLVMDEPTSALDLGNQARVLEVVDGLAGKGYGVLMTTHDPNQAFLLGGKVVCLGRDGNFLYGRAEEVLDEETLSGLYGRRVRVSELQTESGVLRTCAPVIERAM